MLYILVAIASTAEIIVRITLAFSTVLILPAATLAVALITFITEVPMVSMSARALPAIVSSPTPNSSKIAFTPETTPEAASMSMDMSSAISLNAFCSSVSTANNFPLRVVRSSIYSDNCCSLMPMDFPTSIVCSKAVIVVLMF